MKQRLCVWMGTNDFPNDFTKGEIVDVCVLGVFVIYKICFFATLEWFQAVTI